MLLRLSVILGGSYGAGHYGHERQGLRPRFLFALPSAHYSVMGGQQAAKTLLDLQTAQLKRQGIEQDDEALNIRYAARRLWIDEIVLPGGLGYKLIRALEACTQNPDMDDLKVGVFQV